MPYFPDEEPEWPNDFPSDDEDDEDEDCDTVAFGRQARLELKDEGDGARRRDSQ